MAQDISLFGPSDEELMEAQRRQNYERAHQLAQNYRRPGRAVIGSMLGQAAASGLFGLRSPADQELAKRAALKKQLAASGLDPQRDPVKYLAAFSALASKMGMNTYAERAQAKLQELQRYNTDVDFKKRELGQRDTQLSQQADEIAELKRRNLAVEQADEEKTTFQPGIDDPRWRPVLSNLPPELAASAKVNKRGNLEFMFEPKAFGGGSGSGSGNSGGLEPKDLGITLDDLEEIKGAVMNNAAAKVVAEKMGFFGGQTGKLSQQGRDFSMQIGSAVRKMQAIEKARKGTVITSLGSGASTILGSIQKRLDSGESFQKIMADINARLDAEAAKDAK